MNSSFCDQQPKELHMFCHELMNLSLSVSEVINDNKTSTRPTLRWQNAVEMALPIIVSKTEEEHLSTFATYARNMLFDCNLDNQGCLHLATGFFSVQYGMCVTVNIPINHKAQAGGPTEGLSMLLDINFKEYLSTTDSVGVKVFIHHQNKNHDMESSSIYASVGQRTAIALKLVNTTRLGTSYRKCFDEKQSKEKFNNEMYFFSGDYSVSGCMKTCLQKKIISQCGCFLMGYGKPPFESNKIKYCWQKSLSCAMETQQKASDNNEITLSKCGCQPPCHDMQFVATVSTATWPSPNSPYNNLCYVTEENCTDNPMLYHKENTLKLEVFYDTLNYNQYTERPEYTLVALFTDFGKYTF